MKEKKESLGEGVQDIAPIELKDVSGWKSKPVNQYGLDGKFIQTFPSKAKACKETGVNDASLTSCLKGKQQSAKGFQWRWA
jgi:hypothetical protein